MNKRTECPEARVARATIYDLAWEIVHACDEVAVPAAEWLREAGVEPTDAALEQLRQAVQTELDMLADITRQTRDAAIFRRSVS
jgi:hypothetical protein